MSANQSPITIEQYLGFESPDGFRDELIDGRIVVSPEPKPLHSEVAENVFEALKRLVGKKYKVSQRMNLCFPGEYNMPSPDIFVIERREWERALRANCYPEGPRAVLAVEVLSPGNRKKPVQAKINLYMKHGLEAWVVNPQSQEVKIHQSGAPTRTVSLKHDSKLILPPALKGKTVPLATIFRLPKF